MWLAKKNICQIPAMYLLVIIPILYSDHKMYNTHRDTYTNVGNS